MYDVRRRSSISQHIRRIGCSARNQAGDEWIPVVRQSGTGERYHKQLHGSYFKLKLNHHSMQDQLLLSLATKAMNNTLGPEGHVP